MALPFGAEVHAWWHGLFRRSEDWRTRVLFERVEAHFVRHGIATGDGRAHFIDIVAFCVGERIGIPGEHPEFARLQAFTTSLFAYEGLLLLPSIDWHKQRTISEWWDLQEVLRHLEGLVADFDPAFTTICNVVAGIVGPLIEACPALVGPTEGGDGICVETRLIENVPALGTVADKMLAAILGDPDSVAPVFPRLMLQLKRNVVAASGGNPALDPDSFTRMPRWAEQSNERDPAALVRSYLGNTPISSIFETSLAFTIPIATRFEHHHIVAGSGHGKTQTLQYLIANDLDAVARGERTVIVLDSQGDLIRNIAGLELFAPGEPLHDRLVLIDPTDVEWPVSLNLFDVGIERLQAYEPLERERLTNSILELYDFVLGTLLSAEMTQKQNVIFRYVTRLMLHIPDATIHTLRELMEPGSHITFAPHIAKLSGTARHFFETEFAGKEFEATKRQVLRRLWGILENQTFERMFAHPRSKLDIFAEMNAGKVILINTAKDLLKEQGTEIFGRFFIALIAQAAQERATLPERKRMPTFVYVDEAQDYFDRNIGLILAQARKYNVGMVLAHQYLGQLDPRLLDAFAANTAIKFAGGVSTKDARAFAPMLYCTPEFIETQPKGSFAAHVRGRTKQAVSLAFSFGHLEGLPRMNAAQSGQLREMMRDRYAVHYSRIGPITSVKAEEEQETDTSAPDAKRAKGKGANAPASAPTGQVDTDAAEGW